MSRRKTYKEKLRPTPAQERMLDEALWRCRMLYNTALEQRITAWQRCHVSVSRYRAGSGVEGDPGRVSGVCCHPPPCLQDVLARLDKTYQAFFRRVATRARRRASPASRDATATALSPSRSSATAQVGQRLLVLSKIGRIARALVSPALRACPRRSRSPKRPMAGMYASPVPMCRYSPCPGPGRRRGSTWALKPSPRCRMGRASSPRLLPQSRAGMQTASDASRAQEGQPPQAQGSHAASEGASDGAQAAAGLPPQDGARTGAAATTRSITRSCRSANMVKNHHLAKSIRTRGAAFSPS